MNILLINHYAGSVYHGMGLRSYYLAREWVQQGHSVTIVSAAYTHLLINKPDIYTNISKENIDGIRYCWVKTPIYSGNGIGRVWNMLWFAVYIYIKNAQFVSQEQPDVVIASSAHPFVFFGARKIANLFGARLVFEVRDLWPLTLIELGQISRYHPFILLMQWVEKYAYNASDLVMSLLPNAATYMKNHGLKLEKFRYSPNGVAPQDWENKDMLLPLEHTETLSHIHDSKRLVVGYAGAQGLANALGYLIEAARILQDAPLVFVLVGQGPDGAELNRQARDLANVVFLPAIPKTMIPALLDKFDICFIGANRSPIYRFGVSPNKLMDYMMAAKPIVNAIEASNDIVADSNCGITVAPENSAAIAEALKVLMSLTSDDLKAMGERGRKYIMEKHDFRVLATQYLQWVNERVFSSGIK